MGWSLGENHPSDPVYVAGEEFQSSTQVAPPACNLRQAAFLTGTPIFSTEKENNKKPMPTLSFLDQKKIHGAAALVNCK